MIYNRIYPVNITTCCVYLFCIFLVAYLGPHAEALKYDRVQVGDRTDLIRSNLGEGYDFAGQIVGDKKFLIKRHPDNKASITVYINDRLTYTMPDQRINVSGTKFEPGETYKGYDFYLSPDHTYLFVERGLLHDTSVGYLYKRNSSSRMTIVRPHNLRFDEAALRSFAEHEGFDVYTVGQGKRTIDFVRWVHGTHQFECKMAVSSTFEDILAKGDILAEWSFIYDPENSRFKIIGKPDVEVQK